MEKGEEKREGNELGAKRIIFGLIRVLLVIAFVFAFMAGGNLIAIVAVLAFILTFWPQILKNLFGVEMPAGFEVILLLFLYGLFLMGKIQGFHLQIPFWSVLFNVAGSVALGFVGLAVMYTLYKGDKINASPFVIAFFSFCFAVAMGVVWELFEFFLDGAFGFGLQEAGSVLMDLSVNVAGAFVISAVGYSYIKKGKVVIISEVISKFVEKNPKIFGAKMDESKGLLDMIKTGEHKGLEFKSTLRTNLFTKQVDKRVEHSVLKTVAAHLNSGGGTLLVGVGNKGEVIGLGNDLFESSDKLSLHFKNLIKDYIGHEFLPYIQFGLVPVGDKHVMKVDCANSDKHVFLKASGGEEFYVRNGPSSEKLEGSALVNYIKNNFGAI